MYFPNRGRNIVKVCGFVFFNSSQGGWCQGRGAAHADGTAGALGGDTGTCFEKRRQRRRAFKRKQQG